MGIKPLYDAQDGQDIHFASEIKALLHVPGEIHEFPAGHWWGAAHGFVRYFHIYLRGVSGNGIAEKALLRRAFAGIIPEAVLQRPKQKFSAGAGSINLLARYANDCTSDAELVQARQQHPEARLRSKEELLYYRIFGEQFGTRMTAERVGRTRSVTRTELQ